MGRKIIGATVGTNISPRKVLQETENEIQKMIRKELTKDNIHKVLGYNTANEEDLNALEGDLNDLEGDLSTLEGDLNAIEEDMRYIPNKSVVNVLSLGVDNIGKTDCSRILNDYLKGKKNKYVTLYFPVGTYKCDAPIELISKQSVIGEDMNGTVLLGHECIKLTFTEEGTRCIIDNMTIIGSEGYASESALISVYGSTNENGYYYSNVYGFMQNLVLKHGCTGLQVLEKTCRVKLSNILVKCCSKYGIDFRASDSDLLNILCEGCYVGMSITGSNNNAVNLHCSGCGVIRLDGQTWENSYGLFLDGGRNNITNCVVQDNPCNGAYIGGFSNQVRIEADSNSYDLYNDTITDLEGVGVVVVGMYNIIDITADDFRRTPSQYSPFAIHTNARYNTVNATCYRSVMYPDESYTKHCPYNAITFNGKNINTVYKNLINSTDYENDWSTAHGTMTVENGTVLCTTGTTSKLGQYTQSKETFSPSTYLVGAIMSGTVKTSLYFGITDPTNKWTSVTTQSLTLTQEEAIVCEVIKNNTVTGKFEIRDYDEDQTGNEFTFRKPFIIDVSDLTDTQIYNLKSYIKDNFEELYSAKSLTTNLRVKMAELN